MFPSNMWHHCGKGKSSVPQKSSGKGKGTQDGAIAEQQNLDHEHDEEHDEVDEWPASNDKEGFCADCDKPGVWPKHLDRRRSLKSTDGWEDCSGTPHWETKTLCIECRCPLLCECSRCWSKRTPLENPIRHPPVARSWRTTSPRGITTAHVRIPFMASDFQAIRCAGCRLLRPRAPFLPQDRLVCTGGCHTHYCSLQCLEKHFATHWAERGCCANKGQDVLAYFGEVNRKFREQNVLEATEACCAANAGLEKATHELVEMYGDAPEPESSSSSSLPLISSSSSPVTSSSLAPEPESSSSSSSSLPLTSSSLAPESEPPESESSSSLSSLNVRANRTAKGLKGSSSSELVELYDLNDLHTCVNHRERGGIDNEELPYGHFVIDGHREFDYDVGASVETVFGDGANLRSSSGVPVLGQVTVPRSMRPGRLLQICDSGDPSMHAVIDPPRSYIQHLRLRKRKRQRDEKAQMQKERRQLDEEAQMHEEHADPFPPCRPSPSPSEPPSDPPSSSSIPVWRPPGLACGVPWPCPDGRGRCGFCGVILQDSDLVSGEGMCSLHMDVDSDSPWPMDHINPPPS
jgi:hypothetical protein